MPLAPGSRLGPYEIIAPLGAGGMGEVYRARDSRLKRDVAIKVLPPRFTSDPQRMVRFEREAQLLAALNHTNIAHMYGVEESDGTRALVMELVEGPTLADHLAKGPLPLEESLQIAKQIAEGLEYAHDRNVVHRDLKPAYLKVTPEGQIKILDFGLAKALDVDATEGNISTSSTISIAATSAGLLLGTAGYMSPEQAKGKAVDRRTDIWAFGCVLFEMLTGKAAFDGETITDKLAAVVRAEPELEQLPEKAPGRIRELVRRCLIKDPRQRLQAIGEARIALDRCLAGEAEEGGAPSGVTTAKNWMAWTVATLGIVAAVLGTVWLSTRRQPEAKRVVKSVIKPASGTSFLFSGTVSGFALSPNGTALAYVAQAEDGRTRLWVRRMDSTSVQELPGTDEANFPFWSADGTMIGFFAGGKLKKVEASGGAVMVIADAPTGRGGSWSRDGVIVFAPNTYAPVFKVSASGGTATAVTKPDPEHGENTNRWPVFLPDGKHFLYLAGMAITFGSKENPTNWIKIASVEGGESKNLIRVHGSAAYAPGHILFLKQNTLMAQPFDERKLEVTGEAVPVADPVQEEDVILRSTFSVSMNGLLAYAEGTSVVGRELVWFDRTGKRIGELPGAEAYRSPRISPDGRHVTYTRMGNGYDIWSYDVTRGVKTQLTFGFAVGQANVDAVSSPDGKRIAYTSVRNGRYGFYARAADGSGSEETLSNGADTTQSVSDWSQDEKLLLIQRQQQAIYLLKLGSNGEPELLEKSPFPESAPVFSPDAKWLAFCSTESGEQKVYVVPFPGPGGKTQVSPGGGCFPRWRRDGKELFYLSTDNKITSAEVKVTGVNFEIGKVTPLFETRMYRPNGGYDVTADGQKFIVAYEAGQPNAVLTLVENWDARVK